MNNRYFFVTTYDDVSGSFISELLNLHPEIHCSHFANKLVPNSISSIELDENQTSLDNFIKIDSNTYKKFSGNAQLFPAFLLQHKSLTEKTRHPFKKVNIIMAPELRIKSLLASWKKIPYYKLSTLKDIDTFLNKIRTDSPDLCNLYNFNDIFSQVIKYANTVKINTAQADNLLFLVALAIEVTMDTADLPTPGKIVSYEKLFNGYDESLNLMKYLTNNQALTEPSTLSSIQTFIEHKRHRFNELCSLQLENWQHTLINYFLSTRLKTIYYPHISQPMSYFYNENAYHFHQTDHQDKYSKLISIQLNSNRPSQITAYFDNIEETADDPSLIEVLVNIDDNDNAMETTLKREIKHRKFTIKYIKTERPGSFCDLWKPINRLLLITDPNAYFLLNISDEMLFKTVGWDTILKKYVGFFPDDLFRLRASRNKYRNYFDRWECSFTQDSIPITTKRWIDIGGDWNPCFGPDSFQQLISFYLAKDARFSNENYLRDIPLIDIQFHGDVPALGIESDKAWKHGSEHIKAMEICQSYDMQKEAKRRAMLIKANIIAYTNQVDDYTIKDSKHNSKIVLTSNSDKKIIKNLDYRLNFFTITMTNYWRRLYFNSYFGDGLYAENNLIKGFARYLKSKYRSMYKLYYSFDIIKNAKHKIKRGIKKVLRKMMSGLKKVLRKIMKRSVNPILLENLRLKELYNQIMLENEKLKSMVLEHNTRQKTNNLSENTPINSVKNIKVISR